LLNVCVEFIETPIARKMSQLDEDLQSETGSDKSSSESGSESGSQMSGSGEGMKTESSSASSSSASSDSSSSTSDEGVKQQKKWKKKQDRFERRRLRKLARLERKKKKKMMQAGGADDSKYALPCYYCGKRTTGRCKKCKTPCCDGHCMKKGWDLHKKHCQSVAAEAPKQPIAAQRTDFPPIDWSKEPYPQLVPISGKVGEVRLPRLVPITDDDRMRMKMQSEKVPPVSASLFGVDLKTVSALKYEDAEKVRKLLKEWFPFAAWEALNIFETNEKRKTGWLRSNAYARPQALVLVVDNEAATDPLERYKTAFEKDLKKDNVKNARELFNKAVKEWQKLSDVLPFLGLGAATGPMINIKS
jgi:hypothetical protein